MRNLILALSAVGLLAASVPSVAAAPCRDAKGKFVKCPKPAPAKVTKAAPAKAKAAPAKATKCRDTKGKFVKCGTPGAKLA